MSTKCEPAQVPDCPPELEDASLDCEVDDKPYLTALAFARAAAHILKMCGYGCYGEDEEGELFATIGPPRALPFCCEVVAAGIVDYDIETDGPCWTSVRPVIELMISTCKPTFDPEQEAFPSAGPLDGSDGDTLNGHALRVSRMIQVVTDNLAEFACCYFPDYSCACCGGLWRLESSEVNNTQTCTQIRFTVVRG